MARMRCTIREHFSGMDRGVFRVSMVRLKTADTQWSPDRVTSMSGTPGQPAPGQSYNRSPAFTKKYGQAQQAHAEYAPHIAEPVTIRSWKIYKSDIATHGVTPGCPGCRAITIGKQPQSHTMECRVRIEEAIAETAEGKIRLTRAILRKDEPQAPDPSAQGGGDQEIPPIPPTIPVSSFSENIRLRFKLLVHTVADKPYFTSLAIAKTSASDVKDIRVTTGPKISS